MSRLLWSAPLCGFLIYVFSFHFVLEANDPDLGSYSGVNSFQVSVVPEKLQAYTKLASHLNHLLNEEPVNVDRIAVDIFVSGEPSDIQLYLQMHAC